MYYLITTIEHFHGIITALNSNVFVTMLNALQYIAYSAVYIWTNSLCVMYFFV